MIGDGAFTLCKGLKKITLPQSIRKIGRYAFCGTSIRNVHLPDSITTLSNDVFSDCKQLNHISLPTSLESIPSRFLSGTAVQQLDIPDSVKYIGDDFMGHMQNTGLSVKMYGRPPRITPKTFYEVLRVNVSVPKQLYDSYKMARYWQEMNIIPY